ncbi:MAG: SGNH/GDSL hydrolase family protein [Actinobacteria bacterium]|nr:SGNH/GDSL hydrolase family protein [Actinomycetota bacterium]
MTTFVALGDSITLGIGDPVRLAPPAGHRRAKRAWRGWAVLLAETLPDPALHIVAGNGALMADLERDQLPTALQLRPDVASVVIGINDTLRPNFDPTQLADSSAHVIGALRAAGADVLTMRLPEPGRMLHLPEALASPLAKRAHLLNDMMDQLAERFGTLHYDAAGDSLVYDPAMWAVDRLHPSERGHRHIARRFHALLTDAGHVLSPPPGAEPVEEPPTRAEQFAWMATKGTAWVIRRSTDLVPCLLSMAFAEWKAGRAVSLESELEPGVEASLEPALDVGAAAEAETLPEPTVTLNAPEPQQ